MTVCTLAVKPPLYHSSYGTTIINFGYLLNMIIGYAAMHSCTNIYSRCARLGFAHAKYRMALMSPLIQSKSIIILNHALAIAAQPSRGVYLIHEYGRENFTIRGGIVYAHGTNEKAA